MLALKISRTHKLIGSMSVMSSSDYADPTLWSSLAAMGSDVQSLFVKSVPAAPVVNLQPLRDRMSSIESDVLSGSDKLKHQVINLATNLGGRVGKIETAVKRLNSRGFGAGGNHDAALAARFQNLERRVQELDSKLFKALADAESESIKFGGLGLRSKVETRAWIVGNYPEMHYALIFDVCGILEAIEDEGATNQSYLLRDMKKRDDLSINGIAEGQALTAHLHEIPRTFHSNSNKLSNLENNESHLNRMPSYKHWSYGSHCLKRKIESELVKVRYSNRQIIQNHFAAGTMAYSIANEALDKSVTWMTGLISFIDRTYKNLHGGSRFTTAQAWSLTTQLVRRIFSDLHTSRMGTTRTMGKDRVVICTTLLWSTFRTHDKMAELENLNFENHSSISSEYIKFLAMNSGFEALEEVKVKFKSMGDQFKEMQASVKQADKKAENAVTFNEVSKKAIEDLSRRMGVQEGKK
jgi:hypothetical protein